MEHSHLVVVNKADGDLMEAAMRMQYEYTSSLKFMRPISPNWRPKVIGENPFSRNLVNYFQCCHFILFHFCLGHESLFTNQGRIARTVGRHARVSSDYVENRRAPGNAPQTAARLDVELHHSTHHAGVVRVGSCL